MAYAALDYDGNGSIGPDDFDLVARRQVLLDILIAKVSVWPISGGHGDGIGQHPFPFLLFRLLTRLAPQAISRLLTCTLHPCCLGAAGPCKR